MVYRTQLSPLDCFWNIWVIEHAAQRGQQKHQMALQGGQKEAHGAQQSPVDLLSGTCFRPHAAQGAK